MAKGRVMLKICDISILNSCNFHCDYCASGAKSAKKESELVYSINSPVLDFQPLIDFVRTHLQGFVLQVTGGEPLTVAGVEFLINELTKTNFVVIATNGELLPRKYMPNVFYRIGFHPEQRDLEIFKNIMQNIPKEQALINYVLHPRHLENGKAGEYIEFLLGLNKHYEITAFEGEYKGNGVRLFDPMYSGITTPLPQVQDYEMFTIHPDGRVFPCHGFIAENKIGDVYKNELNHDKICKEKCSLNGTVSFCPSYISLVRVLELITP